jgi:hypothetical protein
VDYQKVVRDTVKHIGYDDSAKGKHIPCMLGPVLREGGAPDIRTFLDPVPLSGFDFPDTWSVPGASENARYPRFSYRYP